MQKYYLIFVLITLCLSLDSGKWYSVVQRDEEFKIQEGKQIEGAQSWGYFDDGVYTDGWGKLTLRTNSFQSETEAFAAGYLEGALLSKYIIYHKINYYDEYFVNSIPHDTLVEFFQQQYNFTLVQIQLHKHNSTYWQTVGLFTQFFQGLVDGFNSQVSKENLLSITDFLLMQSSGDMDDLGEIFETGKNHKQMKKSSGISWYDFFRPDFRKHFLITTHCSVLIKIKEDLSDVFMGHNTWESGNMMLRVYKFYEFGDDMNMEFSGYPGVIFSVDDYYVLKKQDQKLFVTETSIEVFNKQLYKHVTYNSLLCWQRVLVANFLAKTGQQWTEIFKKYNSGTYNNQYMIVDTKLFIKGEGPRPGFLWIIEQMPGLIINQDVTDVIIKQGYWASYNIPFIHKIYKYSGYDKAFQKQGDEYSYDKCSRAQIFKREQSSIQILEQFKKLMRLNQFQTDPFSKGDPTMVISARADLYQKVKDRMPYFAYDTKVTTLQRVLNNTQVSDIQNGPSYDDQPPFKWSDFNFIASHVGQPDVWKFPWVTVTPHD